MDSDDSSGLLKGIADDGSEFVLPPVYSELQALNPTRASIFEWIALFLCTLLVCLELFTQTPTIFYICMYLFWRIGYNIGLGFLLDRQSKSRKLEKYITHHTTPNSDGELSMTGKFLVYLMETGSPPGYKREDYPACFNTWLVFKHLETLTLWMDGFSFGVMAYHCADFSRYTKLFSSQEVDTPVSSSTISVWFHLIWDIFGVFLVLLNYYTKEDAHTVVGAYAWFYGDFFFRVKQNLTFDGIYNCVPHPMYTIGYTSYYGVAIIARSRVVFLFAMIGHLLQMVFLYCFEEPHIERTYGSTDEEAKPVHLADAGKVLRHFAETGLDSGKPACACVCHHSGPLLYDYVGVDEEECECPACYCVHKAPEKPHPKSSSDKKEEEAQTSSEEDKCQQTPSAAQTDIPFGVTELKSCECFQPTFETIVGQFCSDANDKGRFKEFRTKLRLFWETFGFRQGRTSQIPIDDSSFSKERRTLHLDALTSLIVICLAVLLQPTNSVLLCFSLITIIIAAYETFGIGMILTTQSRKLQSQAQTHTLYNTGTPFTPELTPDMSPLASPAMTLTEQSDMLGFGDLRPNQNNDPMGTPTKSINSMGQSPKRSHLPIWLAVRLPALLSPDWKRNLANVRAFKQFQEHHDLVSSLKAVSFFITSLLFFKKEALDAAPSSQHPYVMFLVSAFASYGGLSSLSLFMVLLSIVVTLQTFQEIGVFGKFYGDFFVHPLSYITNPKSITPPLHQTGVFHFVNHPYATLSPLWMYGFSLFLHSWELFSIAVILHTFVFISLVCVEQRHMLTIYSPESVKKKSGVILGSMQIVQRKIKKSKRKW
ncbi:putative Phosphatidylethanolamine N-methyltransferase [Blattamonas nauphoetae]|uniref:Phosphatidylethanolamine N-methyltransferase n=1 Tax=Blattamonas nauphoetae TaxID=2049346 RepID=A0ABQ9XHA5_9EUKA|nr:putative Phosphatidylethanolamine N-methyltransferase [Blattamonas nauphoetae]